MARNRITGTVLGNKIDLVTIATADVRVCRLGLDLLLKATDAAKKALRSIAVDDAGVVSRHAEAMQIIEDFRDADAPEAPPADDGETLVREPARKKGDEVPYTVRTELLGTLRVALALEWDKVGKIIDAQEQLAITDDHTRARSKQLSRLLSDLDVASMGGATTET